MEKSVALKSQISELQKELILAQIAESQNQSMDTAISIIAKALHDRKIMPSGIWVKNCYLIDNQKLLFWLNPNDALNYVQSRKGSWAYAKRLTEKFQITKAEDLLSIV